MMTTPLARAHLESLLRDRKLDVTLMSAAPCTLPPSPDEVAATEIPTLDGSQGGLRRGHLSELVGERSSGRTGLLCRIVAAATARGELVALIDTHDRLDPASADAAGVDLTKLLWVRENGDVARALKAMNLVLQAGGFGIVAIDLADARVVSLRTIPFTTWMRLARVIEGSQTVALLVGTEHLARSPGGVTIALDGCRGTQGDWTGAADRARLLRGLTAHPRVIGGRR